MAGSLNKVTLIGRLGKDPEARNLQSGGKVVNLRLATSERYKDRDGQQQERTEWHSVVVYNERLGEIAEKYLRKGNAVYLEGMLQTRKWQGPDGADRYTTEVVLTKFGGAMVLLGGGKDDDAGDAREPEPRRSRTPLNDEVNGKRKAGGGTTGGGGWGGMDDDIPFGAA